MSSSPTTIRQLVVVLLSISSVIANPILEAKPVTGSDALIPRAKKGDKSNPKTAQVSTSGWEDISEEDCYEMLCVQKKTE
jgi:hypothetical protein